MWITLFFGNCSQLTNAIPPMVTPQQWMTHMCAFPTLLHADTDIRIYRIITMVAHISHRLHSCVLTDLLPWSHRLSSMVTIKLLITRRHVCIYRLTTTVTHWFTDILTHSLLVTHTIPTYLIWNSHLFCWRNRILYMYPTYFCGKIFGWFFICSWRPTAAFPAASAPDSLTTPPSALPLPFLTGPRTAAFPAPDYWKTPPSALPLPFLTGPPTAAFPAPDSRTTPPSALPLPFLMGPPTAAFPTPGTRTIKQATGPPVQLVLMLLGCCQWPQRQHNSDFLGCHGVSSGAAEMQENKNEWTQFVKIIQFFFIILIK